MIIQFNTDSNISGSDELSEKFSTPISESLSRFSHQITRIEVHLSDENSNKSGQKDKRCLLEARLEGMQPVAVTSYADTTDKALRGAIEKLKKAIDNATGRMKTY